MHTSRTAARGLHHRALGWQGIIPSKAEKMARKACLMITTKLMNLHDVFEKVRPDGY
jgi:hypothetical protein|tara:strand:- start:25 stop:195 length:171 start_codon:yes stop_codon:yes gene_type:complete